MVDVVEVLYPFDPQSDGDLRIQQGQHVEIIERLSGDWARGKNTATGEVGVFPLNYVKPVNQSNEKFSRPAAPRPQGDNQGHYANNPQKFDEKSNYQPPPANWQQNNPPPQYQQQQYYAPQQYQPPQQQQHQQPYPESVMIPQQQQQQPQQQPQQQQQKHHHFGNVAKRFGDSIVFGAGATLGGDLINKIF